MGKAVKVFVVIILCISGFATYTVYGEHEASTNLESELQEARVKSLGLTSADIEVKLSFHNPTTYDTPHFRVELDAYLSGGYIGHGNIPETKVPAGASINRTMTFTVKYADVAKVIIDSLRNGSFELTVNGTIHTRILLGTIPVSFPFQESRSYS